MVANKVNGFELIELPDGNGLLVHRNAAGDASRTGIYLANHGGKFRVAIGAADADAAAFLDIDPADGRVIVVQA